MTEEEERRLWGQVFDLIPGPFKARVGLRESAVVFREGRVLAGINRRRDGYENDLVIMGQWPWRPMRLAQDQARYIAWALTDAALDAVLASLPLPVAPPLELDETREHICWAPTGEPAASLAAFEDTVDLARYAQRLTGFKYRAALADALREALRGRSVTVVWGAREITVRRKDRTVVIRDGETMAVILLRGGRYGEAGRTVAGADYGAARDGDLLAPAVSFLRFED